MDFSAIEAGTYNCYQSVYAWMLRECGCSYSSVALHFFSFMYESNKSNTVGENIQLKYMRRDIMQDEQLGDIFETWEMLESREVLNTILESGKAVLCWGDLYDCFWNEAYHKYHFGHCYIVHGKKDKYMIFDPFFEKMGVEITYEQLCVCADTFHLFTKAFFPADYYSRVLKEMKEDAIDYLEKKMGDCIIRFAEDLIDADLFDECGGGTIDIYAVPLLDNLKGIMQQRGAYAILVQEVGEKLNLNCSEILEKLIRSKGRWEKLRMYIMKSIIKKKFKCDRDFVETILLEIKELENDVVKAILNL